MFSALLHKIVAHPTFYDLVQTLAGARLVRQRLAASTARLRGRAASVLDVGGGTGTLQSHWPAADYICLDIDMAKLQGFSARRSGKAALQADGMWLPLKDNSIDVVLCAAVTHHIPEAHLPRLISEAARVLGRSGTLILLDAVWNPHRWGSRLLWKYDRGSYPHSAQTLESIISNCCAIAHCEHFAIYHEYVLYLAERSA